jgi:GntR family transcriptional regulator, transcriptional repressor for pyruvate dehydrogenase complex
MFTPIKNTKVYEQVVNQIKGMIISGDLKKGDKLPTERDLAEKLQVSRATVREAIRALEVIGLVESRQGAGNYIKESFEDTLVEPLSMMFMLEESNPQEILELRTVLELETAVLAARKITDEELEELKSLIDKINETTDEDLSVAIDKKFHYTIAKASKNLLIMSVLNVISQLIDEFIKDSRKKILTDEKNRPALIKQHELIYKALANKDVNLAYEAMKGHFNLIEDYMHIDMK